MLRVITFNANGIRAAARKGFFAWLREQRADVLCVQETKAQEHQVPAEALDLDEYRATFVDARKKGYSGVAIFTRHRPDRIVRGLEMPGFDDEGRYLRMDFGDVSIASLYIPSGTTGEVRQAAKEDFLEQLLARLARWRNDGRRHIVCGDWNIAHRAIDIHNPVRNARMSGFLPQERAWLDTVVDRLGWVDAMRVVDPEPGRYTWWSPWAQSFERNVGWRIDYQIVSPELAPTVRRASIERAHRFSDHAPLIIDYEIDLHPVLPEADHA